MNLPCEPRVSFCELTLWGELRAPFCLGGLLRLYPVTMGQQGQVSLATMLDPPLGFLPNTFSSWLAPGSGHPAHFLCHLQPPEAPIWEGLGDSTGWEW